MTNNILKWLATVFTIGGALAVSFSLDPLNVWLFNIGSLLWVIWGIRIREPSIIITNAVIMAIYVYGLFLRI